MPANLTPIFDLGDRDVIKLPDEIGRLRATLARLNAVDEPDPEHPATVAERLVQQTVDAAATDTLDAVDYGSPLAAAHTAAIAQHRREAVVAAVSQVQAALAGAVIRAATDIVTGMQPGFNKAVVELRAALQMAADWSDPAGALTAPAKVRSILASRHDLRREIDAMLAGRDVLRLMGYRSSVDVQGEFGLCRNFDELWPRTARQLHPQPPWNGAPDRLEWWLMNGGDVWLPTVVEQDAQFERAYGDAIRETAQRAKQGRALAEMLGGGTRHHEITIESTPNGLVVTP